MVSGTIPVPFENFLIFVVYAVIMGRAHRVDVGGILYHVINRGNFRSALFANDKEYNDFMDIIERTLETAPMRIVAYCLMPNHWHMILHPENDGDLSKFMQKLSLTHTQRYHARTYTEGYGHIYQGRYKSFPIETNEYFINAVRYVECNAERAGLVSLAEDWRWSSAQIRTRSQDKVKKLKHSQILNPWPIEQPLDYASWLREQHSTSTLDEAYATIRSAIAKNRPYGSSEWTAEMVKKFDLQQTLRNRGSPKRGEMASSALNGT